MASVGPPSGAGIRHCHGPEWQTLLIAAAGSMGYTCCFDCRRACHEGRRFWWINRLVWRFPFKLQVPRMVKWGKGILILKLQYLSGLVGRYLPNRWGTKFLWRPFAYSKKLQFWVNANIGVCKRLFPPATIHFTIPLYWSIINYYRPTCDKLP